MEIGLACIHTYVFTRNAAAAPPVYVLVIHFLASAASYFSAVNYLVPLASFTSLLVINVAPTSTIIAHSGPDEL